MSVWVPGQAVTRPGVYVRVQSFGEPALAGTVQGLVAAALRATWGPIGEVAVLESLAAVDEVLGSGLGTDVAREALRGGAQSVVVSRAGGGTPVAASLTLQDTTGTPVNAVTLTAKYQGTRGNALRVTLRDSLAAPTMRELLVYELVDGANTLRQTIRFDAGVDGGGEPQKLVDAITDSDSPWLTATKLADGNSILAAVGDPTPVALAGGVDPTTDGAAYTAALDVLTAQDWNVLALDTHDTAIHASAQAYIDARRDDGLRRLLVLAEPTSVALATRQANARAFDDPPVIYVGNGFTGSDEVDRDGWAAGARIAGMIAAAPVTNSLTHAVITGGTGVLGALTGSDLEASLNSGMLVFTMSLRKQVQVEYGITTFITPTATLDAGWKKIRRVRTRDELLNRITATWEPLIGQINNSPDGRATLIALGQGIIEELVRDGALLSGRIFEDPARPPAGDAAYFVVEVDDLDSAEKVFLTAQFRFAPPAA
ncbi:MAG: phage tail sheath subtilisin-like domain-containing protein [Chloroflexota bacterium]